MLWGMLETPLLNHSAVCLEPTLWSGHQNEKPAPHSEEQTLFAMTRIDFQMAGIIQGRLGTQIVKCIDSDVLSHVLGSHSSQLLP